MEKRGLLYGLKKSDLMGSLQGSAYANPKLRAVSRWLFVVAFLIFLMVLLGGATRLTRSGLSIVEWKPVTGILPPLSEAAWQNEFEKYKQFPEYKILNHRMNLQEFKGIYYWEYLHRLLGRFIGLAFLAPFLFFWKKGYLAGLGARPFWVMFVLGGLQGALGWFMVKSGLVKEPHVSHYRLAAHLLLAFLVYSYIFYTGLRLWNMNAPHRWDLILELRQRIKEAGFWKSGLGAYFLVLLLLVIQIFYGALTAGLKAGLMANTFPDMNGAMIPAGLFVCGDECSSLHLVIFESPLTVQFLHRGIAWTLLFAIPIFVFSLRRKYKNLNRILFSLMILMFVQFALGVMTLLFHVPVLLGVLHQAGALLLLSSFLVLLHSMLGNTKLPSSSS